MKRRFYFAVFSLVAALLFCAVVTCLDNNLALTPPMGWIAWERFKCTTDCVAYKGNCISENLFMEMADRLVKDGFRDAGYTHINIDDCWLSRHRDADGELVADPERFPHGIKYLADYMHSRGLKLGIYQDFGRHTCMGYPGIIGHMAQDAKTFAKWDIDMVKLDGCHSKPQDMDEGYTIMGKNLNKTGRPMVYSCSWPYYQIINRLEPNYDLIAKTCNMWRVFDDISDSWASIQKTIDFMGDNQEVLTKHVGPGRWTDPDMLVIGNLHLTFAQARIQMAIWAMLPAPLLMSNDLRSLNPKFRKLLQNKNIIAINQDSLGLPGKRIYKKDYVEVWKRPVTPIFGKEKSYALLFLNRQTGYDPIDITFRLKQFGLTNLDGYHLIDLYDDGNYGIVTPVQNVTIGMVGVDSVLLKAEVMGKRKHRT